MSSLGPRPATVALILAGGRGSRLSPLTDHQPKPAVSLAGNYRLIDATLTNLVHSELRDVWVVEQYRPGDLNEHLAGGRPWDLDGTRGGLCIIPPAQGDADDGFSEGNGHALYQQIDKLEAAGADEVLVLSADHLYRLDYRDVLEQHCELGSDLTIVTTQVDTDPSRYGVVEADGDKRVTSYAYKPEDPESQVVAAEIFVFAVGALREAVDKLRTSSDGAELGDYGETIIPWLVENRAVHEFCMDGYWRDLGTIDAYYRAHMDLIEGDELRLQSEDWPMITNLTIATPARISPAARVDASLICPGAIIAGEVESSLIGPGVTVEKGAVVRRSLLLGDTVVPAGATLDSVIADRGAVVPAEQVGETKPGPGNITVLASENA